MSDNDHNDFAMNMREALDAYRKLTNKNYAPIFNSYKKLLEINEHYKTNTRNLDENQIDLINVGLIAAKALDFDTDFKDYAGKLHKVWRSFIYFLSVTYSKYNTGNLLGPRLIAYNFYRKQNFTDADAMGNMQGIDFSKSINDQFILRKTEQFAQWRNPNITEQGNYYTDPGNSPNCLGIHYKEQNKATGDINIRAERIYTVQTNVICLKSYAADVLDIWSIPNQSFNAKGGCIQYFNALNAADFQVK